MKKIFFLFLIYTISIHSQDDSEKIQLYSKNIIGSWVWKHSSGGLSGHEFNTPENLGLNKKWIFTSEGEFIELINNDTSNNYNSYIFETNQSVIDHNNILMLKTFYTLEENKFVSNKINQNHLLKRMLPEYYLIGRLTKDTLTIGDNAYDGMGHLFVREKKKSK
ncbi:MAG: hypothetical protein KGZ58_04470 [Ignavibacteriales bacterium]|nr:hypothetical protein [Ignavibacteriales bacterium]